LAPAVVVEPNQHPTGPQDRSVLRASARLDRDRGFIFVNNYIREQDMPAWPGTQFELKIAEKSILVPQTPVTIPANSYFYWPVNMDYDGVTLSYATAQPILKTHIGSDTYAFFRTIPGIPAEFAFPAEYRLGLKAQLGKLEEGEGLLRIRDVEPGFSVAITIHGKDGNIHFVLLGAEDADNLWRVIIEGKDHLLLTNAQVFNDEQHLTLRQVDNSVFDVGLFPAVHPKAGNDATAQEAGTPMGIFERFIWKVPERKVAIETEQTKAYGKAPQPILGTRATWRKSGVAMAPEESSFTQVGQWRITVPRGAMNGLSDVLLAIHYQGDEARLLTGNRLLTDSFYNGTEWRIGLKRFLSERSGSVFDLQVLPLAKNARIFFEPGLAPAFHENGQAGSLQSIEVRPEYELDLSLPD
jgi:beta-galactosidase